MDWNRAITPVRGVRVCARGYPFRAPAN